MTRPFIGAFKTIGLPGVAGGPRTLVVPYDELLDYKESHPQDGVPTWMRLCLVHWDDVDAFRRAMLPDVRIGLPIGNMKIEFQGGDTETRERLQLLRKQPEAHPKNPKMYAVSADLEGLGWPGKDSRFANLIAFSKAVNVAAEGGAKILVTYKRLKYRVNVSDDDANGLIVASEIQRYVSAKIASVAENLPLQGTRLEFSNAFGSSLGPLPEGLQRTFSKLRVALTWHMVPQITRAANAQIGTVNRRNFMLSIDAGGNPVLEDEATTTYSFLRRLGLATVAGELDTTGELLYLNYETGDPYWTFAGTEVRDIVYNFIYRYPNHNAFFRPVEHRFRQVWARTIDGVTEPGPIGARIGAVPNGRNLYDYADPNNLFKISGSVVVP